MFAGLEVKNAKNKLRRLLQEGARQAKAQEKGKAKKHLDTDDASQTAAAQKVAASVLAVNWLQEDFQHCVVRRTAESRDPWGQPILQPIRHQILKVQVNLTDHENEELDRLTEATEASVYVQEIQLNTDVCDRDTGVDRPWDRSVFNKSTMNNCN